jgi:hypothetical protein
MPTEKERLARAHARLENRQRWGHWLPSGSLERNLVLFHEYFDGDTGRGLGASHQTGWTALVTRCLENVFQRP